VVAVGDQRRDAAIAERLPEPVRVVAAVAEHKGGPPTRASGTASHCRHAVEQRQELGDVVVVAARQRPGQRCPVGVRQEVML
jgi:hypothetical protein